MAESLAGRTYARVYRVERRDDLHAALVEAVRSSGGEPLFASDVDRCPVYLGVERTPDERVGILCYPFRCNTPPIKGRPPDEHRVQIRYGGERSWVDDHPLGFDIASVDTTLVLGVHIEAGLLIGLDPLLYDPLPMGISVEFKQDDVHRAVETGWHVWERENRPGRKRSAARSREGLETLVAFTPDRLLDYAAFERRATGLRLDPPLRFQAARIAGEAPSAELGTRRLEAEFRLTSAQIMEIISARARLSVAVRGGVAEHHLLNHLRDDPDVAQANQIDLDGRPDVEVLTRSGRTVLVECKNVSPKTYASGAPKVEVQKTRSQKNDPAGRFYRPDQFDVVAACLYPVTNQWEFRFKAASELARHGTHPDRLAVLHAVDETWATSLAAALA